MNRRVKEFVDISDHLSPDGLTEKLVAVRDSLPRQWDAEMRVRGD